MVDTVEETSIQEVPVLSLKDRIGIFSLLEMIQKYGRMLCDLAIMLDDRVGDLILGPHADNETLRQVLDLLGKLGALREIGCKSSAIYSERIAETYREDP